MAVSALEGQSGDQRHTQPYGRALRPAGSKVPGVTQVRIRTHVVTGRARLQLMQLVPSRARGGKPGRTEPPYEARPGAQRRQRRQEAVSPKVPRPR